MKTVSAIAVLAAGAMLSGCETLQEIDKGLYQVTEQAAPRDRVTGERTLNLNSREKEIKEGNAPIEKAILELKNKNIPFNEALDIKAFSKLTEILNKIISVSHFSSEKWKILYIPDPSFNAFVTGGTYVVVNKGLMDELTTDDEIAAVMGHEIAHVAAGHISEKQAHLTIMGLAGKKSVSQEGYVEAFTNINEQEADKIGILYASLVGYDPEAASRVWKKMALKSTNEWNYFRSHPADNLRSIQTQGYASEVMRYYYPGHKNENHAELLVCNELWCRKNAAVKPGEGGGLMSALEGALKAVSDNLKAKSERSRQAREIQNQQFEKQYGYRLPSSNTQALASSHIIRFGKTYKGMNVTYTPWTTNDVETTFSQGSSGEIEGTFVEYMNGRAWRGKLRLIRKISNNKFLFEWANSQIGGTVEFRFSSFGSFSGKWEQTHPRRRQKGTWGGQVY
jgi:hypothetical protein